MAARAVRARALCVRVRVLRKSVRVRYACSVRARALRVLHNSACGKRALREAGGKQQEGCKGQSAVKDNAGGRDGRCSGSMLR